jgi:hypothetical protein
VTIARKAESVIFRDVEVDKGAVDVNVAEGVLWLRGEVPTTDLINELETRANEVTEVRRVENLLHVPASPAPTRPQPPAEPAPQVPSVATAGLGVAGGEGTAEQDDSEPTSADER